MIERVVLKIGGSFARSPFLNGWLELAASEASRVVVVAGGGPFADIVRAEQPAIHFDDAAAHDMALMAMSQFARALVSLHSRFDYADTMPAILNSMSENRVPIWAPWPMLRGARDIKTSWDVTSDSLAVWLATALPAERLVIAKHTGAYNADAVDPAFPSFRSRFRGFVEFSGPAAPNSLDDDRSGPDLRSRA